MKAGVWVWAEVGEGFGLGRRFSGELVGPS